MKPVLVIIAAVLWLVSPLGAAAAGEWITAENQDCDLWNPDPYEDQKVRWSGECKDGKAHGEGVAEWYVYERPPDRCECNFVDGKVEGNGIYRWADGVLYVGEFEAGIREGKGFIRYPDNEMYEGDFKNGLPNGWGVQVLPDNTRVMGKFKDGVHIKVD